jgi:hypothetical protein
MRKVLAALTVVSTLSLLPSFAFAHSGHGATDLGFLHLLSAHGREIVELAFGGTLPAFLVACVLVTGGIYVLGRFAALHYQAGRRAQ